MYLSIPERTYLEWKYPTDEEFVNALIKYKEDSKNEIFKESYDFERVLMKEKYGDDFPNNMD